MYIINLIFLVSLCHVHNTVGKNEKNVTKYIVEDVLMAIGFN